LLTVVAIEDTSPDGSSLLKRDLMGQCKLGELKLASFRLERKAWNKQPLTQLGVPWLPSET